MLTVLLVKLLPVILTVDPPRLEPLGPAPAAASPCERRAVEGISYTICVFDRYDPGLRLYLNDEAGTPFGSFNALRETLEAKGNTLRFAMNAGMYHEDRSPVGLYIEDGKELAPLQTGGGYGNFRLLPNGVFVIWQEDGLTGTHIMETSDYQTKMAKDVISYATQSGPMLVIDGDIHPKFNPESTSFKRRNGVGINEDTGQLYFVLSDGWVTFHAFASLFRDELNCENALFLDGSISRLYDGVTGRNDPGVPMGPILALIE
ncbi:MAG: hypothetical protein CMK07_12205 [Ponticaulis sp.]|nr:hypothetical protein [Ponticaulis sp.]